MKSLTTRHWWVMGVAVLILVTGFAVFMSNYESAQADGAHCGTLDGNVMKKHQLQHDITCEGVGVTGFGFRLINGAHLDLDGHTITCGLPPNLVLECIQVQDSGAVVEVSIDLTEDKKSEADSSLSAAVEEQRITKIGARREDSAAREAEIA